MQRPRWILSWFSLPAAILLVVNDKLLFGILPENNKLVEMRVHVPDLDSGAAISLDFGFFKDEAAAFADEDVDAYFDASNLGIAGGLLSVPNASAYLDVHSARERLVVGAKVVTAPQTNHATARTIKGWYSYKPTGPQSGSGID